MRFSNGSVSLFLYIAAIWSSSTTRRKGFVSAGKLDDPFHHVASTGHASIAKNVLVQTIAQSSTNKKFQSNLESVASYAGGMAYDASSNSVFLTGSRFVDDPSSSKVNSDCFLLKLDLSDLSHDDKQYSDGGYEMGCSTVSITSSSAIVVASSETDASEATSQVGIAMNIDKDDNDDSDDIGSVLSSILMNGNKVQYPVAIATSSDSSKVYVAFMSSTDGNTAPGYVADSEYPNWTSSGAKKYGSNYILDVHAYELSSTDGSFSLKWSQEYAATKDGSAVSVDVSGLIIKGDKLVITSGTEGDGDAFGTGNATSPSVDGVMTMLDVNDGTLKGVIRSGQPVNDNITCICDDPQDADAFYICGSISDDSGGTYPILSKFNMASMDAEWTRLYPPQVATGKAIPYGCKVHGSDLYLGGDVFDGAAMANNTSSGKLDVFVVKVATSDGATDWIKQAGSDGDDTLAHGGGIDVDNLGNAIVYGTTDGSFAGAKDAASKKEIFAFVMSKDSGASALASVPAQDETPLTTASLPGCQGSMCDGPTPSPGTASTASVPACQGSMCDGPTPSPGTASVASTTETGSSETASVLYGGSGGGGGESLASDTTNDTAEVTLDSDPTTDVGDGVFAMQFEGPMSANAVAYDAESDTVYFTGSSYFMNGAVTNVPSCYLGELAPLTGYVGAETYGSPIVTDGCSAIVAGPKVGSLFVVGSTAKNGLYHEEGEQVDASSRGFAMQVGLKGQNENSLEVVSGISLTDEVTVYPVSVATDTSEEHIFVASMGSDIDHSTSDVFLAKNERYPDPTYAGHRMFGYKYYLKLSKLSVVQPDQAGNAGGMESTWNTVFATDEGESVYLGGMINVGSNLIVVGTTLGSSDAFGDNPVPALSGFVVKFNHDGEKLGDSRIYSQAEDNSYAEGVCADPEKPESVYVVGRMKESKDSTEAYVAKVNVEDMSLQWLKGVGVAETPGKAFAEATGCAVDSGKVFVAGVARDGSFIEGETSKGGDDIFVSRFDTETGDRDWVRQIGSPKDEEVATGGGITIGPNGSVILVGTTTGNLYRNRSQQETGSPGWEDWKELVVISLSSDGDVDQPIEPLQVSTPVVASMTDSEPQVQHYSPQALEAMAYEEYKPEIIGAIVVASLFVFVFFCWFCVRLQRKKKIAESQKRTMQVFKYLRHFDADDIDIRRSPAGGFHGKYLNDLAYGDVSRQDAGSVSSSRSSRSTGSRSSRSSRRKN